MVLSGDDLGLLFADAALANRGSARASCASSIVSSPGLETLAAQYGARVHRTLTGFKWICRAAVSDPGCVFGYEEALGYCFIGGPGRLAPLDKDGIAAAVHLCELLCNEGSGEALLERLAGLYRRIGLWVSAAISLRFSGVSAGSQAKAAMAALRTEPPRSLGGAEVSRITDYLRDRERRPFYLGAQDLLAFDAAGMRVLVRPSGTEPKLKIYVHLRGELGEGDEFGLARARLRLRAKEIGHRLGNRLTPE